MLYNVYGWKIGAVLRFPPVCLSPSVVRYGSLALSEESSAAELSALGSRGGQEDGNRSKKEQTHHHHGLGSV